MHRRLILSVALCVIALDQVTKLLAVRFLENRPSLPIVGRFLQLTFARNSGAAFSLATSATAVLSAIAVVACIFIIKTATQVTHHAWAFVFAGVLGGAAGNLVDRVFRAPGFFTGHVVDFLELPHWPVFNLADSAIVCSAAVAVVLTFRGIPWKSQ